MRSFFATLKRRLIYREPRREVRSDDAGFEVLVDGRPTSRVQWTEVLEIFAYKDDLFSYDEIRIGFRFAADGSYQSVGEDFVGYRELLAKLTSRFAGFRENWVCDVAFPAFAANRTTLWGEPWAAPQTRA